MEKGKYRHYKGKQYEVIGTAIHSETLEEVVVYKPLYELEPNLEKFEKDAMWVRPRKMFEENVQVNGKTVPRFEYVKK